MTECPGCHKPQPCDWCWAGDFYCPIGKPPRYLDMWDLWRELRKLDERVAALENDLGFAVRFPERYQRSVPE